MRIIKSGRRDIVKQRQQYIDEYDAKKAKYDSEVSEYNRAKENHIDNIKSEVVEAIGKDLLRPFADYLKITVDKPYYNNDNYYIKLEYYPNSETSVRYNETRYHYRGVPFSVKITILTKSDGDVSTKELVTSPNLSGIDNLTPADYDTLIQEIQLFKRIDSINWEELLDRARRGVQREDYVKSPMPGSKNTSLYDTQIQDYDIARTLKGDNWLLVKVNRSETFNAYAAGTPCPQVEGYGWMKLIKSSPAYYHFYWLNEPSDYDVRNRAGRGHTGTYTISAVQRAMSPGNVCKLKKQYFSVPGDKPTYYSTYELCSEELGKSESINEV